MSLVAIAAALRAQCNTNPQQRAWRTLGSGLGIEARPDGTWLLWRERVEPSDLEVKTFARDAKITGGFSIDTKPHQGKIFRRLTPLKEALGSSTCVVCPGCRARSLVSDGKTEFCPACEYGVQQDVPLALEPDDDTPPPADADPYPPPVDANDPPANPLDALEDEISLRHDQRPGVPLERPRSMQPNTVYHFVAFGALWTAKLEVTKHGEGTVRRVVWACLESLEGPHGGMSDGSPEQFSAWFKLHGQLSPLEPPERWRQA
jgi:hypothetical protein